MTWQELLKQEQNKDYMKNIEAFLAKREKEDHAIIYPPRENRFKALEVTPFEKVKAVILGQDPYHGPNQAQGLSFSVPETEKIPPSLKNIYKELESEFHQPICRSGDLSDWARQGVLLLNTVLSVEQGNPLSHSKIGWQNLTDKILRQLNASSQPIVFFLWGKEAQKARSILTNPNHLVIESAHPSPLSARRGFFGSGQFVKANQWLESRGVSGIDWCQSNRHDPQSCLF